MPAQWTCLNLRIIAPLDIVTPNSTSRSAPTAEATERQVDPLPPPHTTGATAFRKQTVAVLDERESVPEIDAWVPGKGLERHRHATAKSAQQDLSQPGADHLWEQ